MGVLAQMFETLLATYASQVRALDVVGSYVAGSVAMGAYEHGRSDVDVVTVVHGAVEPGRIDRLQRELRRVHPGAWRLDAQYVSARAPLARGRRLTAVAREELHRGGLVLAGEPIGAVIPPVTRGELEAEMRWNLDVYWRGRRRQLARFLFEEADRRRLRRGTLTSKRAAARWLPSVMPEAEALVAGLEAGVGVWQRLPRARAVQRLIGAAIIDACPGAGSSR